MLNIVESWLKAKAYVNQLEHYKFEHHYTYVSNIVECKVIILVKSWYIL